MTQINLSTSNSKLRVRNAMKVGLWVVAFLIFFDISVNCFFRFPTNPRQRPSKLQQYFEYGRSIEGKLLRMIGSSDETTAKIALAGWIHNSSSNDVTSRSSENNLISYYGQSFTNHVAEALKQLDGNIVDTRFGGPGSPPNHSFAQYLTTRKEDKSRIVVWGILASSIKGMLTTTGMTWNFEGPAPYTYPRYLLKNGTLEEHWPPIKTLSDLREAFHDEIKWKSYLSFLKDFDQFYDPLVFHKNNFDNSALIRLVRRGYGLRQLRAKNRNDSLWENPEINPVLNAMIVKFKELTLADHKVGVILLLENAGMGDDLYQMVHASLEQTQIPHIRTSQIVSSSDPRNFVSDGHFTKEANKKIAKRLLEIVQKSTTE